MAHTDTRHTATTGWQSYRDPSSIIAYPNPPAPTSRFFGDPGFGKVYWGTSKIPGGREAFMGKRYGSERRYWNNGMGADSDATPAAINWYRSSMTQGRVPWGSFKFNTPSLSWAQVAAGSADAWFDGLLAAFDDIGAGPLCFTPHHEPNGDGQPAADYRAMCTRLKNRIDAAGLDQVILIGGALSAGYYQMSQGGGYNVVDWMRPETCHQPGLDIYFPWSPANGKAFPTVDQNWRLGGVSEIWQVFGANFPLAVGEWGIKTRVDSQGDSTGESEQRMRDSYQFCIDNNIWLCDYFDSGVNSDGAWTLDINYLDQHENPPVRLDTFKELNSRSTSVLLNLGGVLV